jgi:hypothetical protein
VFLAQMPVAFCTAQIKFVLLASENQKKCRARFVEPPKAKIGWLEGSAALGA